MPVPADRQRQSPKTKKEKGGRFVSRIDLWELDPLSLSTLSVTHITRSESGVDEESGVHDDGIDGWMDVCVPGRVGCILVLGADK